MNALKKKLKERKGAYSILAAILILIMVTAMLSFTDVIKKKWILNEVQTIMDSSGINTLQNQVNNKALRAEILSLDEGENGNIEDGANTQTKEFTESKQKKYKESMKKYYIKEIDNQLDAGSTIVSYDVERVDVSFTYDNWGLGDSKTKLPQITLDSVIRMRVATSSTFDLFESVTKEVYSSRNNASFSITYNGTPEDGETELIVRSVTRLVYR